MAISDSARMQLDLLASCRELRHALAASFRFIDMTSREIRFVNSESTLYNLYLNYLAHNGLQDGIGTRADHAIAQAEAADCDGYK